VWEENARWRIGNKEKKQRSEEGGFLEGWINETGKMGNIILKIDGINQMHSV